MTVKIKTYTILFLTIFICLISSACKTNNNILENTENNKNDEKIESHDKSQTELLAEKWVNAVKENDDSQIYNIINDKLKNKIKNDNTIQSKNTWNYNPKSSSQTINSYNIKANEDKAIIQYHFVDDDKIEYTMEEILKFEYNGDEPVISSAIHSSLRDANGEPLNTVIQRNDCDIDEKTWNFLHQAIFTIITESDWSVYEFNEITFDIQNINKTTLSNEVEEISVDFSLNVITQNPYKDPDEVEYIKESKENGRNDYEAMYYEYNEPKQSVFDKFRFICNVDTKTNKYDIGSFHIYYQGYEGPTEIKFEDKRAAAAFWYNTEPEGEWLAAVSKMVSGNDVLVERQILVNDDYNLTDNGSFIMNMDIAEGFTVADDANITIMKDGEQKNITTEEWLKILKIAGDNSDKSYYIKFKQNNSSYVISDVKELI